MSNKGMQVVLLLLIVFTSCKKSNNTKIIASQKPPEKWESLFNGKNLDNWSVKINGYPLHENFKKTFRVSKGVLKVSYDNYENFTNEFGHLFYKVPFKNYKLKLQYRFVEKQVKGGQAWAEKNSGIMIFCQAPETMLLKQAFPLSLEVQLLGGLVSGVSRPSGSLCTPGTIVNIRGKEITDHCSTSTGKTFYGEEWIEAQVHVRKDSITHYINGKPVITYTKPKIGGEFLNATSTNTQAKNGEALKSGYISLQSESHPIEFKNIEILKL